MKLLKEILYKVGITEVVGTTNVAVEHITFDSRDVKPFTLFVAQKGTQVDGHKFIAKAIENGAHVIVCEELPETFQQGVNYVKVANSSSALAYIAANFYDNPSEALKVVAVTGTNGKTSVVTLLHQLFQNLGFKVGMLSTVVNKIGTEDIPSTHTTPDAISLNRLMARMVDEGCMAVFMESSSHAIDQHRVTGMDVDVAVFTNITHDHLDYHGTFSEYIKAKKKLFDSLRSDAVAIFNADDKNGEVMVQNCDGIKKGFGLKTVAEYRAKVLENQFTGLHLTIDQTEVHTHLVGAFNASNILAVYAVAMELHQDKLEVLTEISNLQPVSGRFQYFRTPENISAVVDYAHTPDALKNVLSTIKQIRTGNEQVITVVGCGGDRDKDKRPVMADIACTWSDKVLLTTDNPRTENPQEIINDMQAGVSPVHFKKSMQIVDRKEAIKAAVAMSQAGDIILVAGKGHETYQEVDGVRHHFDDMETLQEMFKRLKNS